MEDSQKTLQQWLLPQVLPGVIHELNNPLGVLIMNVAMLREDLEDLLVNVPASDREAINETIDDMREAIERINTIIKSLGHISLEKNFYERSGIDVKYLVEYAITLYHTEIKRLFSLSIEGPERKYLFAFVEPGRVICAFILALGALIEAGGDRLLTVRLESSPDTDQILCSFVRLGGAKNTNYDKLKIVKEDDFFGYTPIENGVQFRFKPHEQSSLR